MKYLIIILTVLMFNSATAGVALATDGKSEDYTQGYNKGYKVGSFEIFAKFFASMTTKAKGKKAGEDFKNCMFETSHREIGQIRDELLLKFINKRSFECKRKNNL